MKRPVRIGLLLAALALAACQGRLGRPTAGGHSNWWNLYERGHQRLAQGDWQGALEDFERCLGKRPGATFAYARDHWRVRTYGMHQQVNYFPHRELAVALIHLQRPEEAEPLLLQSLGQEPSERAKHFLNLARTRILHGAGLPPPVVRPDLVRIHSNQNHVRISGEAQGEGRIAAVGVNGNFERESLAEKQTRFQRSLWLPDGEHPVEIAVRDLTGQEGKAWVNVVVDRAAPSLWLAPPEPDGRGWRLRGTLTDDHGIAEASVDGRNLLPDADRNPREIPVEIRLAPGAPGHLRIRDAAGNELAMDLARDELPRWLASKEPLLVAGPPPGPAPLSARLTLLGADTLQRVAEPRVFLNGEIVDPDGVKSLRVNGREQLHGVPELRSLVRFATWVPLAEGTNPVELVAEGQRGRLQTQRVEVVHVVPRHTRPEYRLSATLPPFHIPRGAAAPPALQANLRDAFLHVPPPHLARFQILARGPEFEELLRELRISQSDLVDPRARIPFARLATSDLFLNGEVLADAGGLTLRLHTLSTADGTWLASDDVYLDAAETDSAGLLRGLASRVERRFPISPARVQRVGPGKVWLDLPERTSIPLGGRLLVLRDHGADSSGILHHGESRVELLITDAGRRIARIEPAEGKFLVRAGDTLYTK